MKYMVRILALLLLAPLVFAVAPKEFNWIPPTQYVDGTALPDAEIESYNIYCNSTLLGNVPNTGDTDSWTSAPLADGTYACFATTVATNGEESDPSNAANFTVLPSKPEAPTNFTVILP